MADSKVKAYVLPEDAAVASSDAVTFPGFPGVWRKGEPLGVDALGLDPEDAEALQAFADRIEEFGLPLEAADDVDASENEMPASTADIQSHKGALRPRSVGRHPGLSAEESDARDAWEEEHRGDVPEALRAFTPTNIPEGRVDDVVQAIPGMNDAQLAALEAADGRKGVQAAVAKEIESRRAAAETGTTEGEGE